MRRITSVFAAIAITSGACIAFGDKEKNLEKPKVQIPAQVANDGYAYLSNFPAKDVMPLMKAIEEEVKPQLDAKKEMISVSKEYAETILKLLMQDGRVKLTIALQGALQPPPAAPVPPPPTPEAKKEEPKKEEKKK